MKEIWNNIYSFYINRLHPAFDSLVTLLTNNQYAIYILLVAVVILSIVKKKIKIRVLPGVIDIINAIIIILLIVVAYNSFSPAITKFIKSNTSTNSSAPTKSTTKSSSDTKSAPVQQTIPTYAAPKQLYYGGGCYGCYADGCPSSGYSYGGYDVNMYNYYKSLCQQCRCTSSRWQSLWR